MRCFTLAILVVIAASIGVLVGVMLAKPTGTTVAAATQQREEQITVFSLQNPSATIESSSGQWIMAAATSVLLDPAKYPTDAMFRLEVASEATSLWEHSGCFRLAEYNGGDTIPIPGSEICVSPSSSPSVRSAPMQMPSGQREYVVIGRAETPNFGPELRLGRIIVDWQESQVTTVGGTVKLMNGNIGDTADDYSVDKPMPLAASLSLGVLLLGAGGLYVVKMRRG